jgi:hypothetical protein
MDSGDDEGIADFENGDEITLSLQPRGGAVKSIGDVRVAGLSTSDMDINVTCIFAVHGYLDGEGTEPASLLVIRYDLSSFSGGRRFKAFRPTLTLRRHPPGEPSDDPWVEDLIGPGFPGKVYITEKFYRRSKKSSLTPSIAITAPPPVPVSGGLGYAIENTTDWVAIDRYTVQANRRSGQSRGARQNCDTVYWNAEQEKMIKSGIDVIQVAFLVGRKVDSKANANEPKEPNFEVTFGLNADVDLKYAIKNKWKKFRGVKRQDSYIFKPSEGSKKIPDGVDKNFLRKLESTEGREVFRKLAWVHDVELHKPAKFYPCKGITQSLMWFVN